MVVANGSIITINAADQPDLARALRGGGNQFGKTTSLAFIENTKSYLSGQE